MSADIDKTVEAILKKAKAKKPAAKVEPITIGSDPELMIYDLEQDKIVSAIGVLKNDKHTPVDLGNGIKCYADNVMIEFSMPPANSPDELVETFRIVFQRGQDFLGSRYRLVAKAAHEFDKAELKDPKANEVGCNANYDVYAETINAPAQFTNNIRTGSFHIHLGHPCLKEPKDKNQCIKLLDYMLGVPSILFDTDDTGMARRQYYGKAGEFRPTPYGVEYRVLGNWCLRSPASTKACLALANYAVEAIRDKWAEDLFYRFRNYNAKKIINGNLRGEAGAMTGAMPSSTPAFDSCYTPDLYRDWKITIKK